MKSQIPLDPAPFAEIPHDFPDDGTHEIAEDVAYQRLAMVNVVFVGRPFARDREWVLVDTGIIGTAGRIERAARERFGPGARPAAIILTHGHCDHAGCLETLAEKWDTPVYAHVLEAPYLNGQASYPPPDPTVGGGLISTLSPFFPRGPVNVGERLRSLPEDGSIPNLPGWRWIHTPGHSVGHISLWREADRLLIVGDAFITTVQESAYAVAVQKPEMHGPPMYFTPDWKAAGESVGKLAALGPEIVVTGHGAAMRGPEMLRALELLADEFPSIAVPSGTSYLDRPATAEDGSAYRPVF